MRHVKRSEGSSGYRHRNHAPCGYRDRARSSQVEPKRLLSTLGAVTSVTVVGHDGSKELVKITDQQSGPDLAATGRIPRNVLGDTVVRHSSPDSHGKVFQRGAIQRELWLRY